MAWYAAHLIQYARFLDGNQDYYWVYENIVLIECESSEGAYAEAERIGRTTYDHEYEGSPGITLEGRRVMMTFAGVRKLIACENMSGEGPCSLDPDFRPTHGTEITYSQLRVKTAEEFAALVDGEAAPVFYEDAILWPWPRDGRSGG